MSSIADLALLDRFVQKLRGGARLNAEEEQALAEVVSPARAVAPHQDLVIEGDKPKTSFVVCSGWACRYKFLESGKRQIVALLLPGDLFEPFGALPQAMDHSISAITPLTVASFDVAAARRIASDHPNLGRALWWDLMVSQSILYERILSLGRRTASERLGHLFCELYHRLNRVSLTEDYGYEMPVSQADLGDLLGLSAVHINRSLQELRLTGMLSVKARRVTIHDLAGLENASHFEPSYFHLAEDDVPQRLERTSS